MIPYRTKWMLSFGLVLDELLEARGSMIFRSSELSG